VKSGARKQLLRDERQRFLAEEWPTIQATIQRLGFTAEELLKPDSKRRISSVRVARGR
jgi:GntR family transcriptional regulator